VRELSRFERWYGRDDPPVERRLVRAGPLTAELEGPDLRYVRFGGVEVVRRLYAAVRDQNWGTVPPVLSNVELLVEDDRFSLRFDARNVDGTWTRRWASTSRGGARSWASRTAP
jgi:D-apionolactonase